MWASAFPCQHQVGEFLPCSLFLMCACASGSGSCLYFVFCGLLGSGQSEEFKKNEQPGRQKPQEGVCFKPKPTSMNHVIPSAKFA